MQTQPKGQFSPSKPSRRTHEPSPGLGVFVICMILLIAITWAIGLGALLISMEILFLILGFLRYRRGRGYQKFIRMFTAFAIFANDNEPLGPRTPAEYPVVMTGVKLPESDNFLGTMVEGLYDHIVVKINGLRAYGESSVAVERAYLETAEAYKKWDALTPLSIGVSSTTRWRPWTETERKWFIAQNVLPEVIDAFNYITTPDDELSTHQQRWKRRAIHLLARRDVNRLYARRTTQAYIISAKRPRSWGSSLKASDKVSLDDIKRSAIVELATQVVDDLDGIGCVEPRHLNLAGILDFFAEAWMTGPDFERYHKRIEYGEIPIDDSQVKIDDTGRILNNELFWFDGQPKVGIDWICFDGTNYHRIYELTRISPYLRVNTMNLAKRLNLTGSMTLVGATMSSAHESSYNTRMIALHEQVRLSRRQKVYEKHEEREPVEELKRREDARYESGATAMGYNVYLTVGGPSLQALDEFGRQLEQKIRRTPRAKIRVVTGEEYQEDAFITAVLGVNRL